MKVAGSCRYDSGHNRRNEEFSVPTRLMVADKPEAETGLAVLFVLWGGLLNRNARDQAIRHRC